MKPKAITPVQPQPATSDSLSSTPPQSEAPIAVENTTLFTSEYLESMNEILSQQPLEEVLRWCHNSLPNFYQVTSFGSTGMVILHAAHKAGLKIPIIFLDTLHHFEETLEHARSVEDTYGVKVNWYRCKKANTRKEFEEFYRCDDMWVSHPKRYEWLTKVEPLERALEELKVGAWITGRRRDQGALRTDLSILELDPADGRIKVNVLAHWNRQEIWSYIKREAIPYNPLFDKSFTSIGDAVNSAPSTDPSQGERAGRFHQFGGAKTECGIHIRTPKQFDVDAPIVQS